MKNDILNILQTALCIILDSKFFNYNQISGLLKMILTITMNPSIDTSYPLKKLFIDGVNRSTSIQKTAGGKRLNVTRVASLSGHPVIATGILEGLYTKQKLDNDNIQHNFYTIGG